MLKPSKKRLCLNCTPKVISSFRGAVHLLMINFVRSSLIVGNYIVIQLFCDGTLSKYPSAENFCLR